MGARHPAWGIIAAKGSSQHLKRKETLMDRNLFALWPIVPFGGEDPVGTEGTNGDGSQGGTEGAGAQGGTQTGKPEAGKAGGATESDDDDDTEDDEYEGLSAKELKRLLKDTTKDKKSAEKAKAALEKKQTDAERAKNDENTNLKNDIQALRDENGTLRSTLNRQAILGAIRDDARFEWYDPNMVAQQLDPEVVKVSDDGKVEGIKTQLTKVAKDHPFLLKTDKTQQGNGQQNNGGTQGGPTGFQPGQGGASGGGNQTDTKKLAEEYPALALRI